jgi:hypothetical protein
VPTADVGADFDADFDADFGADFAVADLLPPRVAEVRVSAAFAIVAPLAADPAVLGGALLDGGDASGAAAGFAVLPDRAGPAVAFLAADLAGAPAALVPAAVPAPRGRLPCGAASGVSAGSPARPAADLAAVLVFPGVEAPVVGAAVAETGGRDAVARAVLTACPSACLAARGVLAPLLAAAGVFVAAFRVALARSAITPPTYENGRAAGAAHSRGWQGYGTLHRPTTVPHPCFPNHRWPNR